MSHVAFVHRFTKLGNTIAKKRLFSQEALATTMVVPRRIVQKIGLSNGG